MNAFSAKLSTSLLSLIVIAAAGGIFEFLDSDSSSGASVFISGLCAALCILSAIGSLAGLTG